MKLATWNINSVRLRLALLERLIASEQPDVLCLQETKAMDDVFPLSFFENLGYRHAWLKGMKSYNGVAVLSRIPFKNCAFKNWQGKEDCRHVFVTLENGVEVHNFYVPAGGDIPDPAVNDKFAHKLGFLEEMAAWWAERKKDSPDVEKILVGDLNIAPLEHDVWSHKQMMDVVSHTPAEISRLRAVQEAHDFVDAVRHFVPATEKLYSWWSYRSLDWAASNRGRRLDHIWVTPRLVAGLVATRTVKEARGWTEKPSDHVPVLVEVRD